MKKTLESISSLVTTSFNYQKIKDKLVFCGFQHEQSIRGDNYRKTFQRIILPVLIGSTIIAAFAFVPYVADSVYHSLQKPNNQTNMRPISKELMSYYFDSCSSASGDLAGKASVAFLYSKYKQAPEEMDELIQREETYTLKADEVIHCYYVTNDVYDAVQKELLHASPDDFLMPWRGLTSYFNRYNSWDEYLKNQKIMELDVSVGAQSIKTIVDDYYLLDIVRYYNDLSIDNYSFVGFVDYDIENNQALINVDNTADSIKYFSYSFTNPNKLSNRPNYCFLWALDYNSLKIAKENGVEVINETFGYLSHDDNPHYYDDLDECVIKKTYVGSVGKKDYYDVTFDFVKLIELFGFNKEF